MELSDLLSQLNAKAFGQSKWIAKCPAHEDKRPSLTIAEGDDGRILLHCFAGCGIDAITGAIGIEIHDLFPKALVGSRPSRSPFTPRDVLKVLSFEATVVLVAARTMRNGKTLTPEDAARLSTAVGRISEGLEVAA